MTDPEDCDLQGAGSNSLKYPAICKNIRIIFQQYHIADSINLLTNRKLFTRSGELSVITDQVWKKIQGLKVSN